jgi:hypothetical protein
MKSLAKKISQTFVKDSNGIIEDKPNNTLKKKKSIKDMMVDTFKNPFGYLKNGSMNDNVLAKNKNINDARYTTFSSSEYESVFNHSIDPSTFSKSSPSKLIFVPKNLMGEDIKDLQSSIFESEETMINNASDNNTVDSQEFNNITVQVASAEEKIEEEDKEEKLKEINEEKQNSESTFYLDDQINRSDSGYSGKSNTEKKENRYSFFSWSFIKSKISFSKSEVVNFCNDHKLTSYEKYENYNSDNETADISEDKTAIELQVINSNQDQINEKYIVPEPESNGNYVFSI